MHWLAGNSASSCTNITLLCIRTARAHSLLLHAAYPLSEDHKPNRTDERQRIESAGGVVVWAGTWRVGGVLAVSRAFGKDICAAHCVAGHQDWFQSWMLSPMWYNIHTTHYWAWRYLLKQLCISAASGDRLLKRYVVAMPDLQEQQLSSQDDALILASDGLWDVLTNQDAALCIKDIKVTLINPLLALR